MRYSVPGPLLAKIFAPLLATTIVLYSNPLAAEYATHVAYALHCGGCHLPDGRGNPPEVPDLRNELGKIVMLPGGRDYLVRVPGASQAPVSDQQLANIVNWVLENYNAETLPANFEPLTAEEVGRSRKNVLSDPLKHRAELWKHY